MSTIQSKLNPKSLSPLGMEPVTGIEWMIDAFGCDDARLRDLRLVQQICEQVIADLGLKVVGQPQAHRFDEPGGITSMYMLSESHLACHTYPEHRIATFNLYCCRARPTWCWKSELTNRLGATEVHTRQVSRGQRTKTPADDRRRPEVDA